MPHFQVRVHEEELDGNVGGRLVWSLAEALVQVCGERARSMAVAEIFGIPRHRRGVGGVPGGVHAAPSSRSMCARPRRTCRESSGRSGAGEVDPPALT